MGVEEFNVHSVKLPFLSSSIRKYELGGNAPAASHRNQALRNSADQP